jgi:methylmalonyl-CoA mutase cobalamin-binding subunit
MAIPRFTPFESQHDVLVLTSVLIAATVDVCHSIRDALEEQGIEEVAALLLGGLPEVR